MPARAKSDAKAKTKRSSKQPVTGTKKVPPLADRAPVVVARLKKAHKGATVALLFTTPLECLIATMLSAQSTDETVNRVTAELFPKYRTAEDWLAVPEAQLLEELRPTGFFNQKTKAVRGACRMIVEEFGGEVPRTMAELIRLPGVARKTANIVQGNCYPEEHAKDPDAGIAVDTHVGRLAQRLGFSEQKDPDKIERDLMAILPRKEWFPFTYVLIDHGRQVCIARAPRCEECVVNDLCPSSRV